MLPNYYSTLQDYLDHLKFEKRYSPHTLTSYKNDLEQFFQFLSSQFDAPEVPNITSTFVKSWLAEMRSEDMSAKSLNRKISTLKSYFKYQMKLGLVTSSPMATIISPKIKKRLPAFVAKHEMENLQENPDVEDSWKAQTDRLLIDTFYATGMRLSELIGLREKQVDTANSQLKVLGKGNKERIIPISSKLMLEITAYLEAKKRQFEDADSDVLLVNPKGKRLYTKYVYLVVQKALSQVTTLSKKSPHVLRHTFATHLSNAGADLNAIKELLGHSSLASTQVYTHNSIDKLKEVYKKAHPKG